MAWQKSRVSPSSAISSFAVCLPFRQSTGNHGSAARRIVKNIFCGHDGARD